MKYTLTGNDYRHAAEQAMAVYFPETKPEYTEKLNKNYGGDFAVVSVSESSLRTTVSVFIKACGKSGREAEWVQTSLLADEMRRDTLLQNMIKRCFYKVFRSLTGKSLPWGAVTGIRPGKIAEGMLKAGFSPDKVAKKMQREYFVSPQRALLCTDTAVFGLMAEKCLSRNDAALYIGIPFCPTRCAYCSFVSQSTEKSKELISPFLAALYLEAEALARRVRECGINIISVYMGGGTPTTLTADQMDELLRKINCLFDLSHCVEFTVEAGRPDTISPEKLNVLAQNGITRISINPQTMSDKVLSAIGRRHSAADTLNAFEMAKQFPSLSVNADLIAGLPADTPEGFKRSLDMVLSLHPDNITVHTLSVKRGSRLNAEGGEIPDAAAVSEMLDYAALNLRQADYAPYYLYRQKNMAAGGENVGWAKKGTENLYNMLIMEELCSILALGGGASTKLVVPGTGKIKRIFNAKYPLEYIQHSQRICENKEEIVRFYTDEVFRIGK